jgi:hypothetical protein
MLCPFAIVERLGGISDQNYGFVTLSEDMMSEQIRCLHGCKISLFLGTNSINVDVFHDEHNIEVIFCRDGIPVTLDLVMYGTALLRRQMPVKLIKHSPGSE